MAIETIGLLEGGETDLKPEGVWPIHAAPFQSILVHRPTITPLAGMRLEERVLAAVDGVICLKLFNPPRQRFY